MKKNLLTVILTAAFIVIWGIIIYRIVVYFTSLNDNEVELLADNSETVPTTAAYTTYPVDYKVYRDPFRMHSIRDESKQPDKTNIEQKKRTNFRINGIISSKNGFLVIIENLDDKSVHFLREKESYNEIKIVKVKNKVVQILIYKELKEISF